MARLFPLRSETPAQDGPPRVVDLDDEDADAVFGALSSSTARQIYALLDEQPATPSDVADGIDSSIQNVRYHLEKLEDAGLVEVVDTWYSSRGNEMSVYATANGPLIVTSDDTHASQLKEAVSRFLGAIALIGAAAMVVQATAHRLGMTDPGEAAAPAGDDTATDDAASDDTAGADDTSGADDEEFGAQATDDDGADDQEGEAGEAPESPDEDGGVLDTVSGTIMDTVDGFFAGASPGMLFFLGGVTVLMLLGAWWYVSVYRAPVTN